MSKVASKNDWKMNAINLCLREEGRSETIVLVTVTYHTDSYNFHA